MPLPLEGVKVLDLTNVMAGPYCSMVLGDMGAEIIKVENFPEGDTSRRFEPQVNGESYCFAVLNRNKKSLALDMKNPRGKEIVMKLAEEADIVIENFRPGVVRKLGIDYDSLQSLQSATSSMRRCRASARPGRTAPRAASTSSPRAGRAS